MHPGSGLPELVAVLGNGLLELVAVLRLHRSLAVWRSVLLLGREQPQEADLGVLHPHPGNVRLDPGIGQLGPALSDAGQFPWRQVRLGEEEPEEPAQVERPKRYLVDRHPTWEQPDLEGPYEAIWPPPLGRESRLHVGVELPVEPYYLGSELHAICPVGHATGPPGPQPVGVVLRAPLVILDQEVLQEARERWDLRAAVLVLLGTAHT